LFLGPTQSLAAPPGRRGFLGVLPRPGASRRPVRCPSDPRSSNPRQLSCPSELESACASYPACSPGVSIRLARRHFLPDLPRPCRSPSPLAGFRLRSCGPTVFPPSSLPAHFYMCRSSAGSSRFPSEPLPYGFDPAVRNPLPSPRASSHFQDLSEPTYSYTIDKFFRQDLSHLSFQRLDILLH